MVSSANEDTRAVRSSNDSKLIHWKQIAEQLGDVRQVSNADESLTIIRLKKRLQTMSKEELSSAIDEIVSLKLSPETQTTLEEMVLDPMIKQDPQFALAKFTDRFHDNGGGAILALSLALQKWAKSDPTSAIAWFDSQIASGKFSSKSLDGRSRLRTEFEGDLIHLLLMSDPDLANHRLKSISENQRSEIVSQFSKRPLTEVDDQINFAKLVREYLPKKSQTETLASQASSLVTQHGFLGVTSYLARIQATPVERRACIEKAAVSGIHQISRNKITRQDLDTMREWLKAEAPRAADSITGQALSHALISYHRLEFSEAAELALQYQAASGNDNVLSSFLASEPTLKNKEQARVLAEKLSDADLRLSILSQLE